MQTIHSAGDGGDIRRFTPTQFDSKPDLGHGRGFQNLGQALTAARAPSHNLPRRPSLESMSLRELLASGDAPAGDLPRECQGQTDLALAGHCVQRLAARMAGAGRIITEDERQVAIAAGACALTVWRSTV